MEMIKDIIIDFVLFSGIEGFIFCLFFEKIGKCRKFKWYEWLILSVGNCLISKIFPPIIYQIICIIWMLILLKLLNRKQAISYILKSIFCAIAMFYIIEILHSVMIEEFFSYDMILSDNKLKVFLGLIPAKILEIFISIKGENIMKIVVGGVVRK